MIGNKYTTKIEGQTGHVPIEIKLFGGGKKGEALSFPEGKRKIVRLYKEYNH